MVAGAGVEPACPCERLILSQVRMPVSPPGRMVFPFSTGGCLFQAFFALTFKAAVLPLSVGWGNYAPDSPGEVKLPAQGHSGYFIAQLES